MSLAGVHKVPRVWVMVADRHTARIFIRRGDDVSLVAAIAPRGGEQSRMTNRRIGRVFSAGRSSVRHKYDPHMSVSHKEEITFAHEIADWLDAENGKRSFDRLVLIAAPHMLGELRMKIAPRVCARIVAEINKDLTKTSEAVLRAELGKLLWF